MSRSLVFCQTCRFSKEQKHAGDGRTGGEMLCAEMRQLLAERGRADVTVETQECLWSCTRHCNVLIRDTGRFSYVAGDFAPERASAEAILEWFDLHGASSTGQVPFKQWPQGMRGHFIVRIPPVPAPALDHDRD